MASLNHMKLNSILEEQQSQLRKYALELQTALLDHDQLDLDVELVSDVDSSVECIDVTYHDKHMLVRGTVTLKYQRNHHGTSVYRVSTFKTGVIQASDTGIDVPAIMKRIFLTSAPIAYAPFAESVASTFGVYPVQPRTLKLKADEVFSVTITPPLRLGNASMVHDYKIVFSLTISITAASTVRITLYDVNSDEHIFEACSLIELIPRLQEFIEAAQEAF